MVGEGWWTGPYLPGEEQGVVDVAVACPEKEEGGGDDASLFHRTTERAMMR